MAFKTIINFVIPSTKLTDYHLTYLHLMGYIGESKISFNTLNIAGLSLTHFDISVQFSGNFSLTEAQITDNLAVFRSHP